MLLLQEHARILTQNAHLQKQLTHATAQLESQQTQNNTLVASLHNSTAVRP